MPLLKHVLLLLVALMLSACGGGGEEAKSTISLSTSKADFQQQLNAPLVAPVIVDVQFSGDGIVVGYPPNVPEASWLSIRVLSNTQTTARVELALNTNSQLGNLNTTVRFVTGKQDGSNLTFVDLPVSAEVYTPFTVSAPSLDFTQIIGDEPNTKPKAGFALNIGGAKANWTITANVDWLTVSKTSGVGPASVQLTVQKNAGSGNGIITISDALSKQSRDITVRVDRQQNKLVASTLPQALTVTPTTSPAQAVTTLTLTDSVNSTVPNLSLPWTLKQSSAPWLKVDKTQGATATAQVLQVSVDTAFNQLPTGTYDEKLIFSYTTPDNVSKELEIPVKVTSELPSLQLASPYVMMPNTAGTLIIRGYGFDRLSANSRIMIGDNAYPIGTSPTPTQLTVAHSGFAAGVYPVRLDMNSAFPLKSSNLIVKPTVVTSKQTLAVPGSRNAMVFDAERDQLYAYNASLSQLEMFSVQSGKWALSRTKTVSDLSHMALTKDGRQLIATQRNELWSYDLTKENWPATLLLKTSDGNCSTRLSTVATLNDNKVAVGSYFENCSGYTNVYLFDLLRNKTFGTFNAYNSSVNSTIDGAKLVISQNGLSPAPHVQLLDSLAYQPVPTRLAGNFGQAELNSNGTRIMFNHAAIYDGALNVHGVVSSTDNFMQKVAFSRLREQAWVFKVGYQAPFETRLELIDISTATLTSYPIVRSITLSDVTVATPATETVLLVTPDDQMAIISMPNQLIFYPLSEFTSPQ